MAAGALRSGRPGTNGGIAAGDRLAVDEIGLRVLWPIRGRVPLEPPDGGTGINNVSVVLAGQVGTRRFLLMGDVEQEIDPQLLAAGLTRVDLLKVAHHGSRTATTQGFVDAVRPRIAVASAGAGNPYGHPTRVTLERLANAGARVLRTDRDGTVVVSFEADGLIVHTEGARAAPTTPKPSPLGIGGCVPLCHPGDRDRPRTERSCRASRGRAAGATDADGELGRAATVGYHRGDDRSRAGGGRLPPAVPGSPTLVRRHARAVAEVAGWLAGRIDARGVAVDRRLVEAAALLHDADKALPVTDPAPRAPPR